MITNTSWSRIRQVTDPGHDCFERHRRLRGTVDPLSHHRCISQRSNDKTMISPMTAFQIRLPALAEPYRASGGDDRIPYSLLRVATCKSRRGAVQHLPARSGRAPHQPQPLGLHDLPSLSASPGPRRHPAAYLSPHGFAHKVQKGSFSGNRGIRNDAVRIVTCALRLRVSAALFFRPTPISL